MTHLFLFVEYVLTNDIHDKCSPHKSSMGILNMASLETWKNPWAVQIPVRKEDPLFIYYFHTAYVVYIYCGLRYM